MKRLCPWIPAFFLLCAVAVALLPSTAFASAGGGGGLPYEGWLGKVRSSVTGPVAFTVALVAIVGAGATLIWQAGEMSGFLRTLLSIVVIMGFLVGAQNIMANVFGMGAELSVVLSERTILLSRNEHRKPCSRVSV